MPSTSAAGRVREVPIQVRIHRAGNVAKCERPLAIAGIRQRRAHVDDDNRRFAQPIGELFVIEPDLSNRLAVGVSVAITFRDRGLALVAR